MELTEKNKAFIDSMSHRSLLSKWRFSPSGDPWFEGETGKYWGQRMKELRKKDPAQAVQDSKDLSF